MKYTTHVLCSLAVAGGSIFDPNNMFVLIAIIYLDANNIFFHLDPSHVRRSGQSVQWWRWGQWDFCTGPQDATSWKGFSKQRGLPYPPSQGPGMVLPHHIQCDGVLSMPVPSSKKMLKEQMKKWYDSEIRRLSSNLEIIHKFLESSRTLETLVFTHLLWKRSSSHAHGVQHQPSATPKVTIKVTWPVHRCHARSQDVVLLVFGDHSFPSLFLIVFDESIRPYSTIFDHSLHLARPP